MSNYVLFSLLKCKFLSSGYEFTPNLNEIKPIYIFIPSKNCSLEDIL